MYYKKYRTITSEGLKTLSEGRRVEFTQVRSENSWQAAEVEVLETQRRAKGRDYGPFYGDVTIEGERKCCLIYSC